MNKLILLFVSLLSFKCMADQVIDRQQHLSGGEGSVKSSQASAFSLPVTNIGGAKNTLTFHGGNKFFTEAWAQSAGSVSSQDGLGPLFNNNACQNCHIRDGRGHASEAELGKQGSDFNSLLLRASKSDITLQEEEAIKKSLIANVPDTCIGGQLQHQANFSIQKEATQTVSYQYQTASFADGEQVELREPIWHIRGIGCEINDDTVLSARVAPPMIGLGLLELIAAQDIVAQAERQNKRNDGVSGRANYVWSIENNKVMLGRFGWKAGQPSVRQQTAGAFLGDMGLTTSLFSNENCLAHQKGCRAALNGNGDINDPDYNYEVSQKILAKVVFYSQHLAVPERRNAYAENVLAGKRIFNKIGCQQCHTESYTTQASTQLPALSKQKIYPYTDMLLHDMGVALSDFDKHSNPVAGAIKVEYLAQANEWRTPPLWGLGLTKSVDPKATFLHDGRARTILEAVLWHGGEAEKHQQAVLQLTKTERQDLLAFLNDL